MGLRVEVFRREPVYHEVAAYEEVAAFRAVQMVGAHGVAYHEVEVVDVREVAGVFREAEAMHLGALGVGHAYLEEEGENSGPCGTPHMSQVACGGEEDL